MKKGFTLIELLIVIGILAILATVVVVVLNPTQLFAQARDAQRISDMTTLRSALSIYLATVGSPSLGSCPSSGNVIGRGTFAPSSAMIDMGLFGTAATSTFATTTSSRIVTGAGWVDVNLADTPGGSPLSVLPIDLVNNDTYFYGYACSNTDRTFELNANMESTRYSTGADDVESTDGGNRNHLYEVGTDPALDL
jgi:prepilin-type N-terminal cleavage/methylation domain-containing protein